MTCSLGAGTALAAPSAPWTPGAASRHDIELLVDEAGLDLPTTQWPLPRAAVLRAVETLPRALPAALDEARERLLKALEAQQHLQLDIALRSGHADTLVGFGDEATPGSAISLRSPELQGDWFALQAGGRIDVSGNATQTGPRFRTDGSALALETLGVQWQAWTHRSWWGPGWQSSLVLGNNAPAFSGLGFQRASASRSESPWLAWLGPWNFEFFIAQTDDVSVPANPYLVGQRLTLRPFSHLEIGLTRTAQWGGRGRPQSAKSFLDMLIGKGVNADSPGQLQLDPANELAGLDMRLRCFGGAPCAVYAQLIGEDLAGGLPSHDLGLYGIEGWSADGRQRYFAEFAETGCSTPIGRSGIPGCAYRNFSYPQGYASAGRWIGAGIGPDSRLLTVGWLDAQAGSSLRLNAGRVGSRAGRYSPVIDDPEFSGTLLGVSARQRFAWGSATLTPELDLQRVSVAGRAHTDARVGLSLGMNLDGAFAATGAHLGASLSARAASSWQPWLIAAGLIGGAAVFDHTADDYARAHGDNPSAKALKKFGSALPVAGVGLAGASWLAQRDSPQGDLALAGVSAGAAAALASEVAKFAIDRDRPSAELGAASFGQAKRSQSSFPSTHSAVAWAVLTPYAKAYDAPWLYGLAALGNAGRVMSRDHWLSDTVAGAALGYAFGSFAFRRSGAAAEGDGLHLWVSPRAVVLQTSF